MITKYFCCSKSRRNDVEAHPLLNGIEFLEVADDPMVPDKFQTILHVHFIKDIVPDSLTKEQVIIEGGERVKNITVTEISIGYSSSPPFSPPTGDPLKTLIVRVNEAGDFSVYTLRLIKDIKASVPEPPDNYDPVLSSIEFSFKIECRSDFDCKPEHVCEEEPVSLPVINYLAKDYASFRQLMLDRMSLILPQWKERNVSDAGIALVELLAYAGDYISYKQDAIATEAYLGTSRKRISVRRHARLVDYKMHEGCNARAWIHIEVAKGFNSNLNIKRTLTEDGPVVTRFLTKILRDLPKMFTSDDPLFKTAIEEGAMVFEIMHDEELRADHNEMQFYTWGDDQCCLPKGATTASLAGDYSKLKAGQVLIFKEIKGPQTGEEADADPAHRHAVRLKEVRLSYDPLIISSPFSPGMPVTEITWEEADALPFAVCVSSKNGTVPVENVTIVLGNNVLADHGRTVDNRISFSPAGEPESSLEPDTVSESNLTLVNSSSGCSCDDTPSEPIPPRYRPVLKEGPLTYAAPYMHAEPFISATEAIKTVAEKALPEIALARKGVSEEWSPQFDLLNSAANAREFVVEMESDGIAHLRFGDNIHGMRPAPGSKFLAIYRIGNGAVGNVGAESIAYLVSDDPAITDDTIVSVTNLLVAKGGTNPEHIELVRQKAPSAFRVQERAVTRDDYEDVSKRASDSIQRTACSFRWTGSWRTAFLTVDRKEAREVDDDFRNKLRDDIERYRLAGHDLEVDKPRFVSLEMEMEVCVKPNYIASHVRDALVKIFTSRRGGLFHPDNFSFGQTVYQSIFYAAAQKLDGVATVRITRFKRQGDDNNEAIETGKLLLSRLEIARIDNDPNYPDHGIFNLVMKGGK